MTILFMPCTLNGCALWRFYMPHLKIPGSHFAFNPKGPMPTDRIAESDVCVVQRLGTLSNLEAIKKMKAMGKKVIYDLDDNLWDIPRHNSSYKFYQEMKEMFDTCMNECHALVVSTQALRARVVKNLKPRIPVYVIENAIDFDLFYPLPSEKREEVIVGWSGSKTHAKDLADVFKLIPGILADNKRMRFEIVGEDVPDELLNNPQVRTRRPIPIAEYPSRVASWRWDLFLAPLEDTSFTRSKSNIKMLEAGALHRPILVSPVGSYKSFCSLRDDLGFLMCKTKKQWIDKITMFVNHPDERTHYGNLLYEVSKERYEVQLSASRWITLAEDILCR